MLNFLGCLSLSSVGGIQLIIVMILIGLLIPEGFWKDLWCGLTAFVVVVVIIGVIIASLIKIFK